MTRGWSTLLLLAVALGLGAYIYFVEMKREPSDTEKPADRVFANLDTGTISALTVRSANGDETSLRKEGEGWRLVSPIEARADGSEVAGVTSNLGSLDLSRVVDEAPKDLAVFGLESPRIAVGFTTEAGEQRLLVGEQTATGGDVYAKLDAAPRVFLIPSWLEASLDKTTFQLRDKAVVSIDRTKVDAISIIGQPGTIELVREHGDWMLRQPVSARADTGTVDTLLGRLTTGQMQAIVAEEPATLDVYGLAPPRTTVTASGGGTPLAVVLVGSSSGETAVHMKDAARSMVFTVDQSLVADLERAADSYRNRNVFTADTSTATRITVTRDGVARVFERTPAGTGAATPATWAQTSPAPMATPDKIGEFAARLPTLRAESWEARVPRSASTLATIAVVASDGTTETVRFVTDGDGVLAIREGEPGAARLALSSVDDLLRVLDEEPS